MTNFLPAGIINDTIVEIHAKSCDLQNELAQQNLYNVKQGLKEIEELAVELALFLEKLSCQPLIYTGTGTTEEIIRRLEWALTFSEEIDPVEYYRYMEEVKKTAR
jgi:hypothetical protein